MENINQVRKGHAKALLPLGVFLIIYVIASVSSGDFYRMPVSVAFLASAATAILMDRKASVSGKVGDFAKGMGHSDIMLMCLIFILAGAFAQVSRSMGAIDSTVNLGLSLLPSNVLVAGLFAIACFIAISVGTSVGTIVAISPIGVGIAEQIGIPTGLALGAVIGGAMFGDNLSMISDTTIAATRTQGANMRDKFRMNIRIVGPAALVTVLIYLFTGTADASAITAGEYNLLKVTPYIAVLLLALTGMNVILVLSAGILLSSAIGMATGDLDIWGVVDGVKDGMAGMSELVIICMLVGGTVELIRRNGGIDYLIYLITRNVNSKKGAELAIALLITVVDICTANNTIAIIIAGPIAKDISDQYGISPQRSASLLDTFSCFAQGIIPYGAQILAAAAVAGAAISSPFAIMQYLYYPLLMGMVALGVILFSKEK